MNNKSLSKKFIVSVLIAVLVITSLFTWNFSGIAHADEHGIDLALENNSGRTEYFTGESMPLDLVFKANLQDEMFKGAYLLIKADGDDNKYIETMKLIGTSDVLEQGTNYFESFTGFKGMKLYLKNAGDPSYAAKEARIPFEVIFKDYKTPDKSEITLSIELRLEDGRVQAQSNQKVKLTAKTGTPDYAYEVIGKNSYGFVYGGATKQDKLDPDKLADVKFSYNVRNWNITLPEHNIEYGNRTYEKVVIEQPLPEHAEFDPAKNPGWTLDESSNTVKKTVHRDSDDAITNSYQKQFLVLRFPNAETGKSYDATSKITFYPENKGVREENVTITKKVNYKFTKDRVYDSAFTKSFVQNDGTNEVILSSARLKEGLDWSFSIYNSKDKDLIVDQCLDHELDERLMYTYIMPVDGGSQVWAGAKLVNAQKLNNVKVVGIMKDDSKVDLGTTSNNRKLSIPKETAENLKAISLEDFKVNPGKAVKFKVGTTFRGFPEKMPTLDKSKNKYENHCKYEGHIDDSYFVYGGAKQYFKLKEMKLDLGFRLQLHEPWDGKMRGKGQTVGWEPIEDMFNKEVIRGLSPDYKLSKDELQLVLLLPEGVDYKGVDIVKTGGWFSRSSIWKQSDFKYVENYGNSGLNAVLISMPEGKTVKEINKKFSDNATPFCINTKANDYSKAKDNKAILLAKFGGNFVKLEGSRMGQSKGYKDVRDVNQNGDTSEILAFAAATYDYSKVEALSANLESADKTVDNWNMRNNIVTEPGGSFRYKIEYTNNGGKNLDAFEIYDLLPYKGDYTSAIDATDGKYHKRGSEFSNILKGINFVNNPSGKFVVSYTTVDFSNYQADGEKGLVKNPRALQWVESSSFTGNIESVTGIKIALKPGESFNVNETISCILNVEAPTDAKHGAKAINDFVVTTDKSTGTTFRMARTAKMATTSTSLIPQYTPSNAIENIIEVPHNTFTLKKVDEVGKELEGAEFKLTKGGDSWTLKSGKDGIASLTTEDEGLPCNKVDEKGKITGIDLAEGTYTVEETKAPDSCELNSEKKTFEIKAEEEPITLEIKNKYKKIEFKAEKQWVDGPSDKPEVTLYLESSTDGTKWTKVANTEKKLTGTEVIWEDLASKNDKSKDIQYRAREKVDENGLNSSFKPGYKDEKGKTIVTNTYEPGTTNFTAKKQWVDGPKEKPEITFILQQDGNDYPDADVKEMKLKDGTTEATWENLPKTDKTGKTYTYSVKEKQVTGYETSYEKNADGSVTVVNTYVPGTTNFTAKKQWVDGPKEKPEITFILQQDGKDYSDDAVREKKLKDGTTKVTWENLPKTDKQGKAYTYSVKEKAVPGYKTDYKNTDDGSVTVVNTYVPGTTNFTAKKQWVDGPKEKPEITFILQQDDKDYPDAKVKEKKLKDGTTEATWENLPRTDKQGKAYTYSVKEKAVPGYKTDYKNNDDGSVTVVNTYVPGKISFTATKKWIDGPKEKPEITFVLQQDGNDYPDADVKEMKLKDGTTEATWENLPKTDKQGKAYTYSVKEKAVPGYKTDYKNNDDGSVTAVNTYVPETTKFTAKKQWVDGPKEKPEITFVLQQDDKDYPDAKVKEMKLKDGTTEATWENLPKTDKTGKTYTYSVKEKQVTGYETSYEKNDDGSVTVVNTYVPGTTKFTAKKQWVDGPKEKPEITFILQQDGKDYSDDAVREKKLKDGKTKATWENLPKTDKQGKAYTYSVKEKAVPGYKTDYKNNEDGSVTVVNTYVPGIVNLNHTLVDADSEKQLPQEVLSTCPEDKQLKEGDLVKITNQKDVKVKNGVYKFKGWILRKASEDLAQSDIDNKDYFTDDSFTIHEGMSLYGVYEFIPKEDSVTEREDGNRPENPDETDGNTPENPNNTGISRPETPETTTGGHRPETPQVTNRNNTESSGGTEANTRDTSRAENTGDDNTKLYIFALVLLAACLVCLVIVKKKYYNDREDK